MMVIADSARGRRAAELPAFVMEPAVVGSTPPLGLYHLLIAQFLQETETIDLGRPMFPAGSTS